MIIKSNKKSGYLEVEHTYNDMNKADMKDALKLMGFDSVEFNFYRRIDDLDANKQLIMYATLFDDAINVNVYVDAIEVDFGQFMEPTGLIDFVERILQDNNVVYMETVNSSDILCASNSRDMAKKLQRVKSSNVWSYAFNPKDNRVGDMLMQFKNKDGGAGDIYIYYDVPSKIWRQLVGAPSKGHTFWKLIRNVYTYAKLTGDKRTHLPNGI